MTALAKSLRVSARAVMALPKGDRQSSIIHAAADRVEALETAAVKVEKLLAAMEAALALRLPFNGFKEAMAELRAALEYGQ